MIQATIFVGPSRSSLVCFSMNAADFMSQWFPMNDVNNAIDNNNTDDNTIGDNNNINKAL